MPPVRSRPNKWSEVTSGRSTDYVTGVQNPRTSWAAAAKNAAANQAAGVQKAIAEKRYEKGVTRVGDQKWQGKSLSKGATRFPMGVSEAQGDYDAGFAPYAQVIQNTTLPPRFPKGDPRNIERVKAIAMALRAAKEQRG